MYQLFPGQFFRISFKNLFGDGTSLDSCGVNLGLSKAQSLEVM